MPPIRFIITLAALRASARARSYGRVRVTYGVALITEYSMKYGILLKEILR